MNTQLQPQPSRELTLTPAMREKVRSAFERGLSPASINRSMSATNSLVTYARRVGLTKLHP